MEYILQTNEFLDVRPVRGEDCTLYDENGQAYIDFEAGSWATVLGHNHPRVNQAIRRQLDLVSHLNVRHLSPLAEATARELLETLEMPGGKCIFLSSGSEAVEFGVQAARRLSGRPVLLCMAKAYLGAYGSAAQQRPEEWVAFDWQDCLACPQPCDPGCPRLAQLPLERTGGLVLESGNLKGTVRLLPAGLIQTLARLVREQGGLVVANEITTGMGRTGRWYGFQHDGIQPDVVAVGKGLGNGYPVSAVGLRRETAGRLEAGGLLYAQSHQNNPLGLAVAREVLAVMSELKLVERSRAVGAAFLDALNALRQRHALIREARGRGLMIAVEFDGQAPGFAAALQRRLMAHGFLVGCNAGANLLRFYPALTIGEDHIQGLVEALEETLKT
jgi:acetylornithine/N-succinyldiaminopimelate aminotransferase